MTFGGVITSPENTHIKYVRALQKKRVRYRERRFALEGSRLVRHALLTGCRPALAFYTEDFAATAEGHTLVQALSAGADAVWPVSPPVMALMSDTVTPQGILAVVPMSGADLALGRQGSLALILDNVRDPGNLGTILRTAQATGVEAVLLSTGCVDPYAPKVVRAGMGAHLGLHLLPNLDWPAIGGAVAGRQCVLADPEGERDLWQVDWTVPLALVISNEAVGPSAEARAVATSRVRLPMSPGVESLNAAIAAAVFLFEAVRQRRKVAATAESS